MKLTIIMRNTNGQECAHECSKTCGCMCALIHCDHCKCSRKYVTVGNKERRHAKLAIVSKNTECKDRHGAAAASSASAPMRDEARQVTPIEAKLLAGRRKIWIRMAECSGAWSHAETNGDM